MLALVVIPDAVCVLMGVVAAAIDLRHYRIPNWLTASGAALGFAAGAVTQMIVGGVEHGLLAGAGSALLAGAFMLLATVPLGGLRLLGMGDVKLLVAAALCLRWPLALHLLVYTAIAGGAVALAVALRRGVLGSVTRNIVRERADESPAKHRMPYGVAIALGVCWAVASRYHTWLRLL